MSYIESFSCQFLLHITFRYSERLFHRNKLNLDFYDFPSVDSNGLKKFVRNRVQNCLESFQNFL